MKKWLTLFTVYIFSLQVNAQTNSLSMGPNYVNEVFWGLNNGNAGEAAINSWELAFRIGLQTSSIFINSVNGVSLYAVPNVDTAGWYTLDTTGLSSWKQLYNSDSSWEYGAFDRSSTGFPDFSWGDYDFTTHIVTGDSLYVLKLTGTGSTVYKKLWIVEKDFGDWTFRYANLDNTGDKTVTLVGNDYADKNFAYYSVSNETALDIEPPTATWDLVFTRYLALLPPDDTPYPVTGVLSNVGVEVAEARGVDLATVNESDFSDNYTTNISEIGYDWKYFDFTLNQYVILDSLCYFVKALDGNIYKMVFESFDGSSTGNISFSQSNVLVSVNPLNTFLQSATLYPNPGKENVNLIFSAKESMENVNVDVYDVNGTNVLHSFTGAKAGLNQKNIALTGLKDGLYLLRLKSENDVIDLKLMVLN